MLLSVSLGSAFRLSLSVRYTLQDQVLGIFLILLTPAQIARGALTPVYLSRMRVFCVYGTITRYSGSARGPRSALSRMRSVSLDQPSRERSTRPASAASSY